LCIQCRLCCGSARYQFTKLILCKYWAKYYLCEDCGSLQTEEPYWLSDAYENSMASMDCGIMQRNISNLAACISLALIHGYRSFLDFGGGIGILSRLLRDYCFDASSYDLYEKNDFFGGLSRTLKDATPDVVSAFEVIEHFTNPSTDLNYLFINQQKCVIVSTILYDSQDFDWWYLSPESGQHIFFYSRDAMKFIANRYGFNFIIASEYVIFFKKINLIQIVLTKIVLFTKIRRLIRALIMLMPARGVWNDHYQNIADLKLNHHAKNESL